MTLDGHIAYSCGFKHGFTLGVTAARNTLATTEELLDSKTIRMQQRFSEQQIRLKRMEQSKNKSDGEI